MTRGRSVGGPDAHQASAAVLLGSDLDPHAEELPQDIDVASSEARLENGVLTLKLVKVVPATRVAELTIN